MIPRTEVEQIHDSLRWHGVRQADLAREMGADPSQVSRWLSGEREPNEEQLIKMHTALSRLIYG